MPAPIPEETRAAIEQAIREGAGERSRASIAREFGVSPSTVGNIAQAAGITGAFARTKTKNATRARVADLADRRARLAEKFLAVAERAVDRATEQYTLVIATREEVFREQLDEPPAADVRQFLTAAGIGADKHMALIRFDTKDGASDAALSLVDALVGAFGVHPDSDAAADVDDGYPVPLPTAEQQAAAAAALSEQAAAAGEVTS